MISLIVILVCFLFQVVFFFEIPRVRRRVSVCVCVAVNSNASYV